MAVDRRDVERVATLARLDILSKRIARVIQLFQVLSLEHTSKGAELAHDVVNNYPESYLGYRLSADHRRMTRDWNKFDLMVSKIETTNPDSNGLVFLRAAAALQRHADLETAEELYRQALANDPQFVRAQAHLVMAQPDLAGIIREFKKLRRLNPNHQVIRWLDSALGLAYSETR